MHVKIVAEVGCNHMGSFKIAGELIDNAKACGCDYIKFQKRDIDNIPSEKGDKPYLGEQSFGRTYREHRNALEFNKDQWIKLRDYANTVGIGFFGTAFDFSSAEFLCSLQLPFLKIGSGQSKDLGFIRKIHETNNHPMLVISTGMSNQIDVERINIAMDDEKYYLVHSTSTYPCPENEVNLKYLTTLHNEFYGISGHYASGNGAIEAAAVALGATYIERHFTLDRTWKGTDQAASLEPEGMLRVVKSIRSVERAMGNGLKRLMPSELECIKKAQGIYDYNV